MNNTSSRSLADLPDILHEVFSFLDPDIHLSDDNAVYESRRSLAIAARACRGFSTPALRVLWRQLPDDQPLADLLCTLGVAARRHETETRHDERKPARHRLPTYKVRGHPDFVGIEAYKILWKQSRGYDVIYSLICSGDPRAHPHWARFVEYASRVRAITLFAFDGPKWCGLWDELRSATNCAAVLPMLQSVSFCSISERSVNLGTFALISPTVHRLHLPFESRRSSPQRHEMLCTIFSRAFLAAPNVAELRLALPPSRFGLALLQTHCSRVSHIEVDPQLDVQDLGMLAQLPALRSLSISISLLAYPSCSLTFRSLTTLKVAGSWSDISTLLDTLRLPSMHTLSLMAHENGKPAAELAEGAAQCFRTIASRHGSITSLSVFTTSPVRPWVSGCVPPRIPAVPDRFEGKLMDIVHPLLSLHALRHLSVTLPTYFKLTCVASDHRLMAEAWRDLESFHLVIRPYTRLMRIKHAERPYGGPLMGIAHYARNCPRLRLLHLSPMMMGEKALVGVALPLERHGLRTLVIPRVLLPPGREDLSGLISERVGGLFPLAASAFRPERIVMEKHWAVMTGASWCPECAGGPVEPAPPFW
ncbi:hypothetical protein BD309DRAFT_870151 [Dichomitus squalens]|nr:hypothetical protein BD309DRAFT_870151 [Dichomitus squalens]